MLASLPFRRLAPLCAGAGLALLAAGPLAAQSSGGPRRSVPARVRLITLDPGHFHAALVQKFMYPDVDSVVHVYSAGGDDLAQHLARVESFNKRGDQPTRWVEKPYTGK